MTRNTHDLSYKVKNMHRGVLASIAFFLAKIITKGISYITTPIFTRLLSSDEYGQVSVFLTWVHVLGIIAMFSLSSGVFNNGLLDYKNKRDEYSLSMLALSNLITIISFCASGLLLSVFQNRGALDPLLFTLMFIIFFFQPAYDFWTARQRYELKYKALTLWAVFSTLVSQITAIICIFIYDNHPVYARIFGAEVPLILMYVGFYVVLLIKGKGKINTKYWKAAFLFNLPLIPHYLSSYFLNSSDKLMISWLIGDSATAYYSVAYSAAGVMIAIWQAANASLIPYTYEKCKDKNYKAIASVTHSLILVFAVLCVLMIMFGPEVVALMATADYQEAIYAIPPIVGGVFFQVQYYIYANIVYYYKRPKYVMIASVTAAFVNLVLNYIFIAEFGYIAAGYTTLVCYFLQAVIDYVAMRKVINEKVYNMRYIGTLSGGILIIALFGNLLYGNIIMRYVIVLCVFTLCIINRKSIINGVLKLRG